MTDDFDPAQGLPISPPPLTTRPCPKCNGQGTLRRGLPVITIRCPLCHGTKVVPLEA